MRYWLYAMLLLPGLVQSNDGPGESQAAAGWTTFAEGFSSPADGAAIEIAARAHTVPSLTEWNNTALVVDRLEISPRAWTVAVGDPLHLGRLQVVALDPGEQVVGRIPLSFSLQGPNSVLDFNGFRSDGTAILAVKPGEAMIWVESLLPTSSGEPLRGSVVLTVLP